jgi:hypothetical protein
MTPERIACDWNRDAATNQSADPLDHHNGYQIHTPAGSPQVIPPDRDLV